jgi:ParB family chromosome partitioning protein
MRLLHPSKRALRADVGPISGLMLSIQEKGLLEPIVVRPVGEGFEVVAGGRRYEACKRLGWRNVPCHVVELDDKEAFEVSLLENIQRETLNPIEEARAFRNYVTEFGYGAETALAKKIGKSQEYVSKRIGLLSLPEKVQDEIMRRRITPSVAQELTLLNDEEAEDMAVAISLQRLSLRDVRQIIRHSEGKRAGLRDSLPLFDEATEESYDRRVQRVVRELNKAIAILRVAIVRLGEVADGTEDEWLIRESIFVCRDNLRNQIESLTRLKRKIERAQESNPGKLALIE